MRHKVISFSDVDVLNSAIARREGDGWELVPLSVRRMDAETEGGATRSSWTATMCRRPTFKYKVARVRDTDPHEHLEALLNVGYEVVTATRCEGMTQYILRMEDNGGSWRGP